jgi:hypothetical protein
MRTHQNGTWLLKLQGRERKKQAASPNSRRIDGNFFFVWHPFQIGRIYFDFSKYLSSLYHLYQQIVEWPINWGLNDYVDAELRQCDGKRLNEHSTSVSAYKTELARGFVANIVTKNRKTTSYRHWATAVS